MSGSEPRTSTSLSVVPGFRASKLVAGEPLAHAGVGSDAWVLMPTTYVFNKRASWLAMTRTWPWGVGPAGHTAFVGTLQQERLYPQSVSLNAPHSTYFGSAAELGLPGAIALLLLLATVGVCIVRFVRAGPMERWTAAGYAAAGAAFLIEASATDLMNCRHYWWLIAVVASWDVYTRPITAWPRTDA